MKKLYVLILVINFNFFNASAQAEYIDEETSAPYGFLDTEFSANYTRYEGYSLSNINISKNQNPRGFGAGLESHFPFIYLLVHKNKHRFRIADDLVIGASYTSAGLGHGVQWNSSVTSVSMSFALGVQSVYRINKTFDVGLKYYPIFYRGFGSAAGRGYAFHARVDRFYVDYRLVPTVIKSQANSSGSNLLSLKYLYTPISSKKSNYVALSLDWENYQVRGYYSTSPALQAEFNDKTFRWRIMRISWGIYF